MSPSNSLAKRGRHIKSKSGRHAQALALLGAIAATPALGTIYYVSPTGSDSNSGTNPSVPWGTVSKVDSTTFQPGDEILFQYGSTWDASLNATSSGTASAPIVYGAYGNPTQGNPTFVGSNPISAAAFTQVTGTTYETTYNTPVNWFYNNQQFDHESEDALRVAGSSNVSDPATNLNYVENNPNSFYYNSSNGQLFINVGTSLSGQNLAVGTRQNAIASNAMNNLVFENLNTSQTAADNAGYGVQIENSTNVKLLNSTVYLSGKHGVGVTDVVGFVGTNIVVNGTQPDLGYGGASAVATYADANNAVSTGTNNTSVWTNLTYVNQNGAYPVFISHGNANGVASVVINNATASGYGTGIIVYSTSSTETTLINGGHLDDGNSEVDTSNSLINGLTISGTSGSISLGGSNSVIQNSTFVGNAPNPFQGQSGVIIDNGTNNTVRFNTFDNAAYTGPEVGLTSPTSNTTIVGNIMSPTSGPTVPVWTLFSGSPTLQSNYNLLEAGNSYQMGNIYTNEAVSQAQWQAMGYDVSSATGNPIYTDLADGIYMLKSNSPGIGLYTAPINPSLTLANTLLSAANNSGTYNAGLNPNVWPNMNVLPSTLFLNNGLTNSIVPEGNTLSVTATGAILSGSTSTLNLVGNINNSGSLLVLGGLIATGNFTNAGTVVIGGSQLWIPGMTFTNTAGTATFETDTGGPYGPSQSLAVNVTGGTVVFASTQHLLSLNVSTGATVQLTNPSGTGRSVLLTPLLSVTGKLDLTDNDLVVESGNLAAITALVSKGFNNGSWTGNGIISSSAEFASPRNTTLGVILNTVDGVNPLYGSGTARGLFDGISPSPDDVLMKYTYYGDTNLDGKVDGTDYSRIDNGYLRHLTGWYNGDFNYDGIINGSDYTLIDNAFNTQGSILNASLTAAVDTALLSNTAAVPEPMALTLLAITAPLLIRQRRSQSLRYNRIKITIEEL